MAKVTVYSGEGKATGELELNEAVFGVPSRSSVLHQVYVALLANLRQPWAHSKDKGEVAGGGRKPWRQKGTGRARHGSIRSPLWKGGGVTFGPLKTRNYHQKINRKMNAKAVSMSLSDKVRDGKLLVIDGFSMDGKTKTAAYLYAMLPSAGKSTLWLTPENHVFLTRALRNISSIDMQRAADVNVVDLLNHQYIITTKDALAVLEKRFT